MDASERRELTRQVHRSSGAYELVLSPLILGLFGYGLDRWFGTTPVFVVVLAVLGFVGACLKLYFGYEREMAEHEADGAWSKRK